MHNAALAACGIPARYCRVQIRTEELAEALRLLPKARFIGANITIPHKVATLGLVDEVDEHARKIGVVKFSRKALLQLHQRPRIIFAHASNYSPLWSLV